VWVALTDAPASVSFLEFLIIPVMLEVVTCAETKNTMDAQKAESISFLNIQESFYYRAKEQYCGGIKSNLLIKKLLTDGRKPVEGYNY
jgi:hypothetical protein